MTEDELGRILRDHDPAAGRALSPDDAARMKRLMMAAVGEEHGSHLWRPALAAIAVMVLFVVAALLVGNPRREPSASPATQTAEHEPSQPDAEREGDRPAVRQIQYTTEGGTRIIWTLDPDFEL